MHRSTRLLRQAVICLLGLAYLSPASALADDDVRLAPLRKSLALFAQAFNAHDHEAVAKAWRPDAVYVDLEAGARLEGRDQIRDHYAGLFRSQGKLQLQARIDDIELADDAHAYVRGAATITSSGEPLETSFVAELTRQDGQWLLASVEESDADPLADLAWLVGNWLDAGDDRTVRSSYTWNPTGRFLICEYVIEEGGENRQGTHYIAWDEDREALRSWVFSSTGVIAEGQWQARGDHWAIHWTATLPGGRKASATELLTPKDQDSFLVQWTGIDLDGELRPSSEPVVVRRAGVDTSAK